MKKISNRAVVVLGCALTLLIPKSARSATTAVQRLEINVCEFKVPAELAMANATFTVAYVVQVGEDGRPIKVDKEKNDFLTDEPFVQCIKSWILPTGNRQLAVLFTWKHGQGWSELAITCEDFSYRIKFRPGAFAQYKPD